MQSRKQLISQYNGIKTNSHKKAEIGGMIKAMTNKELENQVDDFIETGNAPNIKFVFLLVAFSLSIFTVGFYATDAIEVLSK